MCMCVRMLSLNCLLTGKHAHRRFLHTAALTLQDVLSILSGRALHSVGQPRDSEVLLQNISMWIYILRVLRV